jgi:hypothetical protein
VRMSSKYLVFSELFITVYNDKIILVLEPREGIALVTEEVTGR